MKIVKTSGYSVLRIAMFALIVAVLGGYSLIARSQSAINYGDNVISEILECTQVRDYDFPGNANDRIVANVTECSDFGGICRGVATLGFDQCVDLFDEAGNLIGNNCTPIENNRNNRFRTRIAETLDSDSNHRISVRDANNLGRGTFSIFLQRVNGPVGAAPLNAVEDLVFELGCGEVDTYTFQGRSGDHIRIEMVPDQIGSIEPRLELYNSAGDALDLPASGLIDRVLLTDGTYTVLARSDTSQTGSYRLSFTQTSNAVLCDIELNSTTYDLGVDSSIDISQFRLANTGQDAAPIEIKLWLDVPQSNSLSLLSQGSDGNLSLPAGFDQDFAPITLLSLDSGIPLGAWAIGCRLLNPVTGATIDQQTFDFVVQ